LETPGRGVESREPAAAVAQPSADPAPRVTTKRRDLLIGIALGILLGIAVVMAFVFFGSRETIDAPSIDDKPSAERSAEPPDRR
jgi:hypothetical protein